MTWSPVENRVRYECFPRVLSSFAGVYTVPYVSCLKTVSRREVNVVGTDRNHRKKIFFMM